MEPIIRILEVELENFKNVGKGKITFPTSQNFSTENSDIIGLYGQNGSGKTAMVEAFNVLKRFLKGAKFPNEYNHLIFSGKDTCLVNIRVFNRGRRGKALCRV